MATYLLSAMLLTTPVLDPAGTSGLGIAVLQFAPVTIEGGEPTTMISNSMLKLLNRIDIDTMQFRR